MTPRARSARFAALSLLAAGLAAAPGPASASPEDLFGYGARAGALGATGAADAIGFEAVWANPALLSVAPERRLTLGLVGAVFDYHAAGRPLAYQPLRGGVIGATLPIPFGGPLADRVALGLGFFTPFDVIVRGRILYPETPQYLLADRAQSVAVQVGLGADVGHGLRLGGGFAALAALSGSVSVATDASGRVGTVVENTLVASYAPVAGASYDLGAYRLGAIFRGELAGRFNVVINVRDLGEIVVPPLHISGVAQYDPWQIALEVARVRGPWRVALGATYKHWAAYPGPAEATVRCPPFGVLASTQQPLTDAPFTGLCDVEVPQDPGYSSTLVPRAGVERRLDPRPGVAMFLRAGLFFEPSPAPEQTGASNLYDNARFAFTLGYGLDLDAPLPGLRFDTFAQAHVLLPRTHDKEGGAPAVDTGGWILAGGTTVGVAF